MRPRRLHVLIVDPAVGVDVVAEVRRIGPFTQMSLDVANIAVTDPTVAVHVALSGSIRLSRRRPGLPIVSWTLVRVIVTSCWLQV